MCHTEEEEVALQPVGNGGPALQGQSNWAAPMEALGSSRSQQPSWLP